ncbi:methyltransferase domain-containing protein [Thermobifida halotolerans]|uniref:Methyltransferase domain-containing protein n=1 Tax=Thermobifida halotolerans TaxID=483545 RepID=A0AA97M5J7_9ACTN|nr:class I SAM-dependent methyltransferase [Thermobifida halotolerans]UOE21539.1 methyltransferase domain-containing protein [Thermobifida halotolerans]
MENGDPGAASMGTWDERAASLAAAFNNIGEHYDDAFPHKEGQVECVRGLLDRLPAGARVLDLGCGTGVPTSRQLAAAGYRVTGTDISPTMIDLARRNVPEADFAVADIMDLDADQRYDAVVAFFSLLVLPRARIPEALAAIHRALVPGGWFCLSMVEADIDDVPIHFLGNQVHVSGYLRDELRTVVESAGFTVEDENAFSYAPASSQAYPEVQLFLTCRRAD